MARLIDLREAPGAEPGHICKSEGKFPRMVQFPDGTLFVTTHRGTHKVGPANAQYGFRSADGGRTWEGPFALCDRAGVDPRSPAIGVAPDGTLCAGWKELPLDWPEESEVVFYRSADRGETWRRVGVADVPGKDRLGHTFGKLVFEEDGVILMHVYTFAKGEAERQTAPRESWLLESSDGGATWAPRGKIADDANETSVIRRRDGSLLAAVRACGAEGQRLITVTSTDGGRVWGARQAITGVHEIPGGWLKLSEGRLVCFYGHRNPPYGVRGRISFDEGETWREDVTLVVDDTWPTRDCGYPTAERLPDGTCVVAWYVNHDDPEDVLEQRQCRRLVFTEQALLRSVD